MKRTFTKYPSNYIKSSYDRAEIIQQRVPHIIDWGESMYGGYFFNYIGEDKEVNGCHADSIEELETQANSLGFTLKGVKRFDNTSGPLGWDLADVEGSSDLDNADSHDGDKEYYYQSKFPKNMVDALYDAGYLKKPWTAISPDQSVFNAMNQAALYSSDESLLSYIFSYNDEYGSRYLDKRFAMNDNVPEYILRDLYIIYSDGTIRGDYDELLVYVIKNPNTPLDIIQALAKSDSRLIRSNAEAELNKR